MVEYFSLIRLNLGIRVGSFFAIWPFFETIFTIRPYAKHFLKIDRISAFWNSTPWYEARRCVTQRRRCATSSTTTVVENTWPDYGVKWPSAEPHTSTLNDLAPRSAVVHSKAQFARRPTYLGVLPFIAKPHSSASHDSTPSSD